MPALPLQDDDVKAVAEYIHSVLSTVARAGCAAGERRAAAESDRRRRRRGPGILRGQVQLVPLADRRSAGHRDRRTRTARSCRTSGSRAMRRRAGAAAAAAAGVARPARLIRRRRPRRSRCPRARRSKARRRASTTSSSRSARPMAVSARSRATAPAEGRDQGSARAAQGAAHDADRQGHARRDRVPGDTEMTVQKIAR